MAPLMTRRAGGDKRIEQVIAFVSDLEVARAAYNAAVQAKPG